MPAALIVLAGVSVSAYFLPPQRLTGLAGEIFASAFYVENWWLASKSVDCLASDEAATPVRHYWSLSIEEQFYVFWPLLIAAGTHFFAKRANFRKWFMTFWMSGIMAASLACSIIITQTDASAAYF